MKIPIRLVLAWYVLTAPSFALARDWMESHTLYLARQGSLEKGIRHYQHLVKEHQQHNFPLLESLIETFLLQEMQSSKEDRQVRALVGLNISERWDNFAILKAGMKSHFPGVKAFALQILSQVEDDRSHFLIKEALSSPYPAIQLKAAHFLTLRKSSLSAQWIEGIMRRFPVEFWPCFSKLFAIVNTPESLAILQQLSSHPYLALRLSALHAAVDCYCASFAPTLKAALTHSNEAEREIAAWGLGSFQDSSMNARLRQMATNGTNAENLSASRALIALGEEQWIETIIDKAKKHNTKAILLLGNHKKGLPVLENLLQSNDFSVKLHAALALLQQKNGAGIQSLYTALETDSYFFASAPSLGQTLCSWKVLPSQQQTNPELREALKQSTYFFKENILIQALELPKPQFLALSEHVLQKGDRALISPLMHLLEATACEEVVLLLEKYAHAWDNLYAKLHCQLALFRLDKGALYENSLLSYMQTHQKNIILNLSPKPDKKSTSSSLFSLEEQTALLYEIYDTLANLHTEKSVHILLNALLDAHPDNRAIIGGFLLKTIQ